MIGLLLVALFVGPAVAAILWHDGVALALASASLSASAAVLGFGLVAASLRPAHRRRWRFHERGKARGRFGASWHAVAH